MDAKSAIPNPFIAMRANEIFRLNKSAINPIIGGPIKNPKNEIVETKAKATLGANCLDLPAML